ncbi:unnamed protein product, partial [marine sediment metagenome]
GNNGDVDPTTTTNIGIGSKDTYNDDHYDGYLDEVRLANTLRSDDWIAAQYLSTNDNLITFGTEEESGAISISSADNQSFTVGQSPTTIETITITESPSTATITAANDIRVKIPTGFNMTWDYTDTIATIGGGAASKVSTSTSYEDSNKTLVINVTSDFATSDSITISDLSFCNFTATSSTDNLELEVDNASTTVAYDDKTITINPGGASYLKVTGTATMTAGGSNELTITAYDLNDNVATGYTGSKSLTFSGPANAPDGTVPTVEGTNIGTSTIVNFTSGQSDADAATLIAYKAETT